MLGVTIMLMLVLEFFSWWYGRGWKQVANNLPLRLQSVANGFSVTQLMRTLFSPWRRIITYGGGSIGERFRAWGDNAFSRMIGFFVRLGVLFAALIILVVTALVSILELVVWPLLPPAIPVLIIAGLVV